MTVFSHSPQIVGSSKSNTQLLALARRAYESIPYYTSSLATVNFDAPSLGITDLPMLTKETVRAVQGDIVKSGYKSRTDVIVEYTSGSTGIPLRLFRNRTEVMKGGRALWRARSEIFPDVMFTPGVQVSASELIAPETTDDHTVVLSAFDLRPDRVSHYLDAIDYHQPTWLRGHPAVLAILAEGLRRANRHLRSPLSFVESNSGWLSTETRDLLAEAFNCRVVNHYGTRETYTISYECSTGTMHILDDCVVAEIHPRPDVNSNELVVSSLIFEVMPFIRYRVGDFVELRNVSCSCGKTTPELRPLGGRSNEVIEGTALVGTYVFHVLITRLIKSGFDGIMQYQVIQNGRKSFDVYLVLKDSGHLDFVAAKFQEEAEAILPGAHFSFRTIDYIEPTRGGKVQVFLKCL